MAATTFQEILSQFLEEKPPFSQEDVTRNPEFRPQFTSHEPTFIWERPSQIPSKKSGYKAPPRSENPDRPSENHSENRAKTVPIPSEKVWNIEKMSPEIQLQLEILTRMGANFDGKISISLLKKAHRRLARQFHPDKNEKGGEHFLRLQSIYEELSLALARV